MTVRWMRSEYFTYLQNYSIPTKCSKRRWDSLVISRKNWKRKNAYFLSKPVVALSNILIQMAEEQEAAELVSCDY